jgi:hypothetical protein
MKHYHPWQCTYSEYFDLYVEALNYERQKQIEAIYSNPFADTTTVKIQANPYYNDNINPQNG